MGLQAGRAGLREVQLKRVMTRAPEGDGSRYYGIAAKMRKGKEKGGGSGYCLEPAGSGAPYGGVTLFMEGRR